MNEIHLIWKESNSANQPKEKDVKAVVLGSKDSSLLDPNDNDDSKAYYWF